MGYHITTKNKKTILRYLFERGVLVSKKDNFAKKHMYLDVPNLDVFLLMRSFKSKELVTETFSFGHFYWILTAEGIISVRKDLGLPESAVPSSFKVANNRAKTGVKELDEKLEEGAEAAEPTIEEIKAENAAS